jgi:hypothetical protein
VWRRGDVVADRHELVVPLDLPAGTYQLLTGMYDAVTGMRLPTSEVRDSILLTSVISS